jgi:hypothetical protein
VSSEVEWVADDLMGGVVYRLGSGAPPPRLFWLPEGAVAPWPIEQPASPIAVIAVDGRPILLVSVFGEGDVDYPVSVGRRDLATGLTSISDVVTSWVGEDGGLRPSTAGGGVLAGAASIAVGSGGTSRQIAFWDLEGNPVSVAGNPFPESCEPCELSIRLGPDGETLAYLYRPDARWPPQEADEIPIDEWWEASQLIPAQLVVVDVATGEEVFRAEVPAGTWLTDYDGRFLVVAEVPYRTGDGVVESTVYDALGADEPLTLPGTVVLARDRLGWPSVPGCSAEGMPATPGLQDGLPDAVAQTRAAIVAAATSCDIDALSQLATAAPWFDSGPGEWWPSPAYMWTHVEQELRDGSGVLAAMVGVLDTPYATYERSDGSTTWRYYVWPYLDQDTDLTDEDWAVLSGVYTAEEIEQMAAHAESGYLGLRIGILTDGTWVLAAAGD